MFETEKLRLTFRGKIKFSSHFSITVLDAAVIETLVLLTGLNDDQGHSRVVSCTAVGDINIGLHHHSEAACFLRHF